MGHIPLDVITEAASAKSLEPAWLWLYLNGFKRRVPNDIRAKIEREILGRDGFFDQEPLDQDPAA